VLLNTHVSFENLTMLIITYMRIDSKYHAILSLYAKLEIPCFMHSKHVVSKFNSFSAEYIFITFS